MFFLVFGVMFLCSSDFLKFFFVFVLLQEKMKSKNKLVPRLLGITKESVMRVDERTKDVVQEWPLTTVKRWAASPKSFTLVSRALWENITTAAPGFLTEAPARIPRF